MKRLFSKANKRYVLALLTAVYTLNFLDRGLISLVLQPIKEDLRLTDTQLGFLTGIAFGLFYATLGLPIARWADRGNRVTITSIAIALWGAAVMSCIFIGNFTQLVIARIAAAVGESGSLPPGYSLLGDYFPGPAERARAMSIYLMAGPLAWLISFIGGGWLNERYGWRVAFSVMGVPALLFAILVKMTIAEPRLHIDHELRERQLPRMWNVLVTLWNQRSSRHLGLGIILLYTMELGLLPWYAAFMIRSHGMDTAALGVWFGLIFGVGGTAGLLLGGHVAGRWFVGDEPGQVRAAAIMTGSLIPLFVLFLLLPTKQPALIALVPFVVVANIFTGPVFALMQRLVADEIRATTMAVVMLLANLIGMGLGPQLVGILSDLLKPALGQNSLRYAMLAMSFVALWAAYHFWRVGRTVKQDLAVAQIRSHALSAADKCVLPEA
jgi:MFS family permease